jgi:nucleoid-associated protein
MRLDLDRLHQAARINFGKFFEYEEESDPDEKKEINYLTFISPSKDVKTSGYFITALGCSAGSTSSRATKAVIQETTAFFRNNDGLVGSADSFRKSLMEYLTAKEEKQESVKLSEIGQLVARHIPTELADKSDNLINEIITKLNGEDVGVPAEFPVSPRELKKHTHISGKAAHWKVEFDREAIGVTDAAPIYYNQEQGTITFKDIPTELQDVIEYELAQRTL